MKEVAFLISIVILLAACGTSPEQQTAMTATAMKATANSWTPTASATSSPTPTQSSTATNTATLTPSPTFTRTPKPTPSPSQILSGPIITPEEVNGYCANSYWPIVEGAVWEYTGTITSSDNPEQTVITKTITQSWEITNIEGEFPYPAYFNMNYDRYFCDETGIYWIDEEGGRNLWLPAESQLTVGYTVEVPNQYYYVTVYPITTITIPIGTFIAQPIAYEGEGGVVWYYVKGIGVIYYYGGYMAVRHIYLVNYSIP